MLSVGAGLVAVKVCIPSAYTTEATPLASVHFTRTTLESALIVVSIDGLIKAIIGGTLSVKVGSYFMKSAMTLVFAFIDASVAVTVILFMAPSDRLVTVAVQMESELFVAGKLAVPRPNITDATPLVSLQTTLTAYELALTLWLSAAGSKRRMVGPVFSLSYLIFTVAVATL